jgi:hypothetical protein
MKTIITILITFLMIGCGDKTSSEKKELSRNSRIHYKEDIYMGGSLYIVEVDSVEYLVNLHGGIIRLK